MGQPGGCRIRILLMGPNRTLEKGSPRLSLSLDGSGMTLKLLISKNEIGGNLGACYSLWVTMGVAKPIVVNLNSKKL